ncbi:MAG: PspC domain-containing protein [candidate division Zixibacteria bacterium]|nr:PspC domain-containing protein [candidate division Zixibacteria bacterium]
MKKHIHRSNQSKVIAGVCGGMGEYFDVDPTWIRLVFVLLIFASGFGLLAYVIAWIVVPRQPAVIDVRTSSPASGTGGAAPTAQAATKHGHGFLPGVILIGLGFVFLFRRLFFWFDFEYVWPLILIVIGSALIYRTMAPQYRHEPTKSAEGQTEEGANAGR